MININFESIDTKFTEKQNQKVTKNALIVTKKAIKVTKIQAKNHVILRFERLLLLTSVALHYKYI